MGEWLQRALPDLAPPFSFELIAAGGSNLTYRVTSRDGDAVALRRPPEGPTLATAHDIDREWRVLSALHRSATVPVPACLSRCDDPGVTGAPFYVMEFVDGVILRTAGDAARLTASAAHTAAAALVSAQVRFHTLDLTAVGLADLGRHDGYVRRQLRRWRTQVERAAPTRRRAVMVEIHDALERRVPPERVAPALVHGDYRFDNVVLGPDNEIAAVLDWELATTGDPLADFTWSLQYWADPGDEIQWLPDPPTVAPGFPRRAHVADEYAAETGFDLSDLPFYEAFSWWKQACIVEGAHARRLVGSGGGMAAAPIERIAERADHLFAHARALVAALD